MSLTITRNTRLPLVQMGALSGIHAIMAFDSSLADGGETVASATAGIRAADVVGVTVLGKNAEAMAYDFQYNHETNKMAALKPQPALIVAEVVAIASHVGTLQKIPGYIFAVNVTAGGVTGAFRIIPVGETPATGQVAVNFLTGGLTFYSGDAVTSVKISYIPLGVGPFIEANRVIDESNAGSNDTTRDLAFRAGLIQYFWNDTAGTLPTLVPVGEAPGSGEAAIDINNAGTTTITVNAAQDDATYKITYWKHSALAAYGWTDQADIAATSNAVVLAEVLDLGGILIPGFGNVLVAEDGTTNKQALILDASGSAATNVAVFDPAKGTITFDAGDSIDTVEIPYIVLHAAMLDNALAEVPAGQNLADCELRVIIWTIPFGV